MHYMTYAKSHFPLVSPGSSPALDHPANLKGRYAIPRGIPKNIRLKFLRRVVIIPVSEYAVLTTVLRRREVLRVESFA